MKPFPFKKIDKARLSATYQKFFTEQGFWLKVKNYARKAGLKTTYTALLLYFAFRRKETPAWAKRIVLGVLGYFIAPIDLLPDLTPIIGYTDDIGVLLFGLSTIAVYINKEVRTQAQSKLEQWFGAVESTDLKDIDDRL